MPGLVATEATDVLGEEADGAGKGLVMDGAGLRRLRAVVMRLRDGYAAVHAGHKVRFFTAELVQTGHQRKSARPLTASVRSTPDNLGCAGAEKSDQESEASRDRPLQVAWPLRRAPGHRSGIAQRGWAVLAQVLKPRLTLGRVIDALRNPLYRTGYALVGNTIGTTVVGFIYWVIAAHLYNREALGRCSALVSALIVVSFLAQLDLQTTLARFLPQAGRSAGRFIAYSYGVSSVAAVAVGVAFVTVLPRLNSHWQFLRTSGPLGLIFVAAVVVWGIFALEDAALTGLHRAVVVPVENSIYGVVKLLLLLGMASILASTGIFIAWLVPLLVIVPAVNWLIFRRFVRGREPAAASTLRAREVIHFAAIDYVGMLFSECYGYVLPLLVLSILGPAANGSFFIAWTIASGLELVAFNFGTSLLVEGVRAPNRLAELTRGVLARCALVTISGSVVLALGRHLILRVFGPTYADASVLLVLLGMASIPYSVVIVAFALDRIERRVGRATVTQMALAVLTLGSSLLLIRKLGIDGIGLAWLGTSSIVAVARFPTIARAVRQPSAPAPMPQPQQEPGSRVYGAGDDQTVIPSPLAWETARYQGVTGNIPPRPEDETLVLPALAWETARYREVTGNIPPGPEDETLVLPALAWETARYREVTGNIPPGPKRMKQVSRRGPRMKQVSRRGPRMKHLSSRRGRQGQRMIRLWWVISRSSRLVSCRDPTCWRG